MRNRRERLRVCRLATAHHTGATPAGNGVGQPHTTRLRLVNGLSRWPSAMGKRSAGRPSSPPCPTGSRSPCTARGEVPGWGQGQRPSTAQLQVLAESGFSASSPTQFQLLASSCWSCLLWKHGQEQGQFLTSHFFLHVSAEPDQSAFPKPPIPPPPRRRERRGRSHTDSPRAASLHQAVLGQPTLAINPLQRGG